MTRDSRRRRTKKEEEDEEEESSPQEKFAPTLVDRLLSLSHSHSLLPPSLGFHRCIRHTDTLSRPPTRASAYTRYRSRKTEADALAMNGSTCRLQELLLMKKPPPTLAPASVQQSLQQSSPQTQQQSSGSKSRRGAQATGRRSLQSCSSRSRRADSALDATTTTTAAGASSRDSRRRYSCLRCSYATDRRDLFTRHENIHRDEKPFRCYVCNKMFK